jgi:4-alpha-glucanotransferase
MPDALLRSAWHSRAGAVVFPLQDLLGLGTEARMNTPSTVTGNWTWRFSWSQVPAGLAAGCRQRALAAGRLRVQGDAAPVRRLYSAS